MRGQPGPIHLRIVTLDQGDFFGSLVAQVVPLVVRVVFHTESATDPVGVNEANRDEVVLGVEMVPIRDRERFVVNWVSNRTPDVNDANSTLQETRSFVTEVTMNSSDTGFVGLVNVDTFLLRQT